MYNVRSIIIDYSDIYEFQSFVKARKLCIYKMQVKHGEPISFKDMTYLRIFLVYLFAQTTNVSTGGSPTHLSISLKLNVKNRNKDSQICNTAACNKTVQELLKYMDLEADPCKDFYQFSCGNSIKKEIPPGKTRIGVIENIKEDIMRNVKGILEGPPSEAKDNFEKQTKMTFQACVDTAAIDSGGVKALKDVLKRFGGWPLVEGDKWKEEECNLTTIFTEYQLYGMLSIFNMITADIPRIIPSYSPNDPYKANATILGIYKQFILNASLYLGEVEKSDNLIKAVDGIIDFGKSLYECLPVQQPTLNATNPEILKKLFEKTFDFESLLKSFYKNAGFDLSPNEIIGMTHPPYFDCLAQLLEVTSKSAIVNYLVWNMIQRSLSAMPSQFVQFSNNFNSEIGFPSKNSIRWQSCIDITTEYLSKALGHLYVMQHFSQTSKNKVLDLLQRTKDSFKRLIANEKWLTKESKVAMIAKIEQMKDNIGYPDYIYDPRIFDDEFNGVNFSGQSFLEIFLAINMLRAKETVKKMKNPGLTIMPVTFINAYYQEYTDELAFSPAILTSPYYAESFPMSLNFGAIGRTMGHEITHALGIIGYKVVVNGVVKELWEGETRENFLKRSECVIKQFDGITTETNIKVNGNTSRAENIADAGGLRIAYMAYKRWRNEYGEEKQLPGFPYSSDQLYFIGMGVTFCRRHSNEDPEYKPNHTHPPHRIRVNMSLKNFKTFSKVFKCKANSEMNISERCRVW